MENQLTLFEEVPKSFYVRKVERVLYEYPSLKAAIENELELEKIGLGNLFPGMTSKYGDDTPRGGEISKPTENYGVKRADKKIKLGQIERALHALNNDERSLIDRKYLDPSMPSDRRVYLEWGMGNTAYYKLKDQVLRKVANALNII